MPQLAPLVDFFGCHFSVVFRPVARVRWCQSQLERRAYDDVRPSRNELDRDVSQ
jgi:hypothetical protein